MFSTKDGFDSKLFFYLYKNTNEKKMRAVLVNICLGCDLKRERAAVGQDLTTLILMFQIIKSFIPVGLIIF